MAHWGSAPNLQTQRRGSSVSSRRKGLARRQQRCPEAQGARRGQIQCPAATPTKQRSLGVRQQLAQGRQQARQVHEVLIWEGCPARLGALRAAEQGRWGG